MNVQVPIVDGVRRRRKLPPADAFAWWLRRHFVIPAVRAVLEREGDGPRWRTAIFSTPRKLGKTHLLAALLLGRMCPDSPIYVPGFAGAVAAPSEKHAGFIATAMLALMDAAGRGDQIKRRVDPKPGRIECGGGVLWLSSARARKVMGWTLTAR